GVLRERRSSGMPVRRPVPGRRRGARALGGGARHRAAWLRATPPARPGTRAPRRGGSGATGPGASPRPSTRRAQTRGRRWTAMQPARRAKARRTNRGRLDLSSRSPPLFRTFALDHLPECRKVAVGQVLVGEDMLEEPERVAAEDPPQECAGGGRIGLV